MINRIFKPQILLVAILIIAASLRFWNISKNPPGLYWDEAAFGYDAYSILKIGKDQHGATMPLFFESFGDWKLPGYFYFLVPTVAVFGLSEFAVRFPSALFGTLTVLTFYLTVKKLTGKDKLALFSAFFLAISPWHIQFSRGGFESTVGLFFVTFAFYLFITALEKPKALYFGISFLSFVLSLYFYHAYRIFSPLFFLGLLFIYRNKIKSFWRKLVVPFILAFLFLLPITIFTFSEDGRARAISQTAFKDEDFQAARLAFDQKSLKKSRFLSSYLYKKPFYYSYLAGKAYLAHFSPIFLFYKGDQIGRHSQVDMGQIYLFEGILFILSLFLIRKVKGVNLIFLWLVLSPLPAMIVTPVPHAYRTLQMVVPISFFSGLGAYFLFSKKGFLVFKILLAFVILYSFLAYTHLLFNHYPKKFNADWQDGYRDMVSKIEKYQAHYRKVYVTDINQVPYIYLLFYEKYSPQKFLDNGGNRNQFDKYTFISPDYDVYNKGRLLYVAPSWQRVDGRWLDAINDLAGRHLYSLWEIDEK